MRQAGGAIVPWRGADVPGLQEEIMIRKIGEH